MHTLWTVTWRSGSGRLTVGSRRLPGPPAGPAPGVSALEVPDGRNDLVRCPRPDRVLVHQCRAAGVSRVPRRIQRPDPPGLRAGPAPVPLSKRSAPVTPDRVFTVRTHGMPGRPGGSR